MKDQWFGDKKDVFKFGICLKLLEGIGLQKLTWIAMRTKNINEEPYNDLNWVDKELREFFFNLRKPAIGPKLEMIQCLMKEKGIYCVPISDPFEAKRRKEYFEKIVSNTDNLTSALILVDPDNGFETDSFKDESDKHILFEEIKYLLQKMQNSILAVFQHQQRGKSYTDTFNYIMDKLNKEPNITFYCLGVKNNKAQSMIVLLFKDREFRTKTRNILKNYEMKNAKVRYFEVIE